jgi:YVTN family beta-propeller protein
MRCGEGEQGGRRMFRHGSRFTDAFGALALAMLLLGLAAPLALAHDVYVTNSFSESVSVLDSSTGQAVGGPIAVGEKPGGIAIAPDGKRVYVANFVSDTVSAINTASRTVVGSPIDVGDGPRGVAVAPDGRYVYVANEESGTVSVIATATGTVVGNPIGVGLQPQGIAITPDGSRAYVANKGADTVSVIDTESAEVVGAPIAVGSNPLAVAITPDGSRAYVTNRSSVTVSVIDTATNGVVETIPVGEAGNLAIGVAITPDGSRAYVSNWSLDKVLVIDTASEETVGEPIDVGDRPFGIAFTPDGRRAFVADENSNAASVIDTASEETVGEPIDVGVAPLGVAVVPDQPPLAALASRDGIAGQPIRFDASASTDPDGQVARYDWNFGDGQTALDAGPTPTHSYSATGDYEVTVTVTDSEGCSTRFVFTGLTASCNGSPLARAASTVNVGHLDPGRRFPSNLFGIGGLHRDGNHGTAKLEVAVPGPGVLQLGGGRVRTLERTVGVARTVNLEVRPKRSAMEALKRRGELKVRVKITFRPDGGIDRTRTKVIKLVYGPRAPVAHQT